MKKSLVILICWCSLLFYCNAQSVSNVTSFQMTLPNITGKAFFVENPNIESLMIEYKQGRSISLGMFYQSNESQNNNSDEFYDLTFTGDQYILAKRYKSYDFLHYPKVGLINEKISIRPVEHQYRVKEIINKDSIMYEVTINHVFGDDVGVLGPDQVTATYIDGSEKLTSNIISCCTIGQDRKSSIADAVFLYRGTVDRDGSLSDVALILGKSSDLSASMKKCVEDTSGSWRPALQGGRPVKSLVDIFIQFKRNEEVVVSFSGLNRR